MKLTGDKVLLKNITEKTVGGIFLPQFGKIPYSLYEVVAIGPGWYSPQLNKNLPNDIRIGDRVLANCGVAKEINISKNGQKVKYFLLDNTEECAIILDEDEDI